MEFSIVTNGVLGENAYVIRGKNGQALIIDPGVDVRMTDEVLYKLGSKCEAVLLTHAHYDHAAITARYQKRGAKVYLHPDDADLIDADGNLAGFFGAQMEKFTPDVLVHDGDEIDICGVKVYVIHTPGHTKGSVCYLIDDVLFSGDTLFFMSVGRTDFPSGNASELKDSLAKLFMLDGNVVVYAGHDRSTTIAFEKENNPYV